MGTALRLTAKNQVTLKKEFLLHLGITAGDRIHVSKLPNGELRIRAEKKKTASHKSFRDFAGCLGNPHDVHLSIDELNEAIANAGAAAGSEGLKLK